MNSNEILAAIKTGQLVNIAYAKDGRGIWISKEDLTPGMQYRDINQFYDQEKPPWIN